ncbi:MAG: DUF523 domain-containing protein [Bdellovibrionales bacterium]|nr:DUF523 domain-containing protein [Bdellovibrionales bacterium]
MRYDGHHKLATSNIPNDLLEEVEWVEMCPEVFMGLGVPRPPMNLYSTDTHSLKLLEVVNKSDHTELANKKMYELINMYSNINVWVLKSQSPSCGYQSTPHYADLNEENYVLGHGLFVNLLIEKSENLKIFDEQIFLNLQNYKTFLKQIAL